MAEPRPNKLTAKAQARPYAKAAYEFAKEKKTVFDWEEKLALLAEVVQAQENQLLRNPAITVEKTRDIMATVMDKMDMSAPEKNFINLLIDNKKLSLLPLVYDDFVERRKKAANIVDVTITSARELTPKQLADLTDSIEKKFNAKAAPTVKIDEKLIGGVKIQVGDQVYDGSLRSKLDALRKHLKNSR